MESILQEDKDFLLAQGEKVRSRPIAGVDKKLAAMEKRVSERYKKMFAKQP